MAVESITDTTKATPIMLMSTGHKIPCACGISAEDARGVMLQKEINDIRTISTDEAITDKINQGEIYLPVYRVDQISGICEEYGMGAQDSQDYSTFVMIDSKIALVIFNLATGKLQIIKEYSTSSG